MGDLQIVVRSKCCLQINREKVQIMGTMSLATFLIISLINLTFAPYVFLQQSILLPTPSPSLCNTLPLTHTLSLCLSIVLLSSPHFPFDIKSLASISTLSLIAINSSDSHRYFTQRLLTIIKIKQNHHKINKTKIINLKLSKSC